MKGRARGRTGFTLLEVIVTLVLFGIVAVMLGPYLLGPVSRSSAPLENLKKGISLQESMEKIIFKYNNVSLPDLKDWINSNASGKYVVVTNGYYKLGESNKFEPDASGKNELLLVTIKSLTTGEQLTMLFAKK